MCISSRLSALRRLFAHLRAGTFIALPSRIAFDFRTRRSQRLQGFFELAKASYPCDRFSPRFVVHWDAIAAELSWLQDVLPSERNGHGEALFTAPGADTLPLPQADALIGPGPSGVGAAHAAASRFVCRSAFCHNDLLSGNFLIDASSPLFHQQDKKGAAAGEPAADAASVPPATAPDSAGPASGPAAPAGLRKHHSTDGSGRDGRAGSVSSDDGESASAAAAAAAPGAAGAPPTRAVLIDYEYADTNYVAYDLANHLCEHAGFDCDWHGCFPRRSVRLDLLRLYADACGRHGSASGGSGAASSSASGSSSSGSAARTAASAWSDADVDVMLRWVDGFALASDFWWGLWALVQSKHSPIDFDFESYCGKRMHGYAFHKAELFPHAPRVVLVTPVAGPAAATAGTAHPATAAAAGSV